ncbi:hypothetical protein HQ576_08870 [bacterium]|nr:hypothetical protein [bacterium]
MSERRNHTSSSRVGLILVAAAVLLAGCGDSGPREGEAPAEPPAKAPAAKALDLPLHYELVRSFDSGLTKLKGIAIDAKDQVYLAGTEGVRVTDAEGKLLRSLPTSGPAVAVAVDDEGNVFAALHNQVATFDATGKPLATWGKRGAGRGQISYVTGIAASGANVYVADAANRCIHRFAANGDFINAIGERDTDAGVPGLVCPSPYLDCTVAPNGDVLAINPGRLRIERYASDGELLGHWGEGGTKPGQFSGCCNPTHLGLLADGKVVTADKLPPRVKVYDAKGTLLAHIGQEHFEKGAAGLDVAADSKGRLFVADPESGKVHVFAIKTEKEPAP